MAPGKLNDVGPLTGSNEDEDSLLEPLRFVNENTP